jgi:hypothetical protein
MTEPAAIPPDEISAAIDAEIESQRRAGNLVVRPEYRCRVCRDEDVRKLVNRLIANGLSYQAIEECLEPINATRPQKKRILYTSIWNHAQRHFDVQEPSRHIYRLLMERRAAENGQDLREGIEHGVSDMVYLETMMLKGYAKLNTEEDNVSVEMGASAAVKLGELKRKAYGAAKMAQIMEEMTQIHAAIREIMPSTMYESFVRRLRGEEDPQILDAESEEVVEEFTVPVDHDERDVL